MIQNEINSIFYANTTNLDTVLAISDGIPTPSHPPRTYLSITSLSSFPHLLHQTASSHLLQISMHEETDHVSEVKPCSTLAAATVELDLTQSIHFCAPRDCVRASKAAARVSWRLVSFGALMMAETIRISALVVHDAWNLVVFLLAGSTNFVLPFSLFIFATGDRMHKIWFSSSPPATTCMYIWLPPRH